MVDSAAARRSHAHTTLRMQDDLRGAPASAYPQTMLRRSLSLLLALIGSAQAPSLAVAATPGDVDGRFQALFKEGKYREAARVSAEALNELPENRDTRMERNSWATRSMNSHIKAFMADTTQCTVATAGLALADEYLATLKTTYDAEVTTTDEYVAMQGKRGELEGQRTQHGCLAAAVPAAVGDPGPGQPGATPPTAIASAPPRPNTRGLAIGLGVSAAIAVGMTAGSIGVYMQVRNFGPYYDKIQKAFSKGGLPMNDDTHLCKVGKDIDGVTEACNARNARARVYYATTALAGVFAVSTAVFTGLLIHKRRKSSATASWWHRHQAQLGATPHRGGGASLTAGFQF